MSDSYHHGNLREALIETGLRYVNENGEDSLSLRKVASLCGVSHAAPYAHFEDKEALLCAIKDTVTGQFANELKRTIAENEKAGTEAALLAMGKSYVMFFVHHPDYFNFLFYKQKLEFHTQIDKDHSEDYEPFLIFKELFKKYVNESELNLDREGQEIELIKTWNVVHGLSALACMNSVSCSFDWKEIVDKCLK